MQKAARTAHRRGATALLANDPSTHKLARVAGLNVVTPDGHPRGGLPGAGLSKACVQVGESRGHHIDHFEAGLAQKHRMCPGLSRMAPGFLLQPPTRDPGRTAGGITIMIKAQRLKRGLQERRGERIETAIQLLIRRTRFPLRVVHVTWHQGPSARHLSRHLRLFTQGGFNLVRPLSHAHQLGPVSCPLQRLVLEASGALSPAPVRKS